MKPLFFILGLFLSVAFGNPIHRLDSEQCTTCDLVVEVVHDLLGEDAMKDCIVEFVTYVCTALNIEDHFVCQGVLSDFKDTFIYVLQTTIVEPKEICGLVISDCDGGFDPNNATWILPMPGVKPPHQDPPAIPDGKPTLKVLHLSDVHVDNDYIVGAEAKCGEPLCCRPPQANEGKDVTVPAGKWGTIGDCDAPYWLFTDMLQNIAANHKDLDYIVVTGDLESHAVWDYSNLTHAAKVQNISRTIKQYLPGVNTYFAVGNHEGVPIDCFAPHFTPKQFHLDFLYNTMAEEWKDWISPDQLPTVQYNGCYMQQLFPGLRLISLNNGLGDTVNFFLYINQTDPDGTMTWFLEQLADAERNNQKVQIIAHIPGGGGEALEGWAINYYNAVNRYENIIVGQFFGHTHSEQFYMLYEDPENAFSRPTGVIYSAPSVTTYSDYQPAYRIYTIDGNYDGSTFQVIDFEEYYLDLGEANANPDAPTQWKQLYSSVKAEYGLKSLTPAEWNNLIERMLFDDTTFNKYIKNKYRRTDITCTGDCRKSTLCDARKAHHSDVLCLDLNIIGKKSSERLYNGRKIKSTLNFSVKTKEEAMKHVLGMNIIGADDKCKT